MIGAAAKDKFMRGSSSETRPKRSSSRRRHEPRKEEGFSSSDDLEAGRRHHHRKDRRRSKDRGRQSSRALVPAKDFTLQLKAPSYHGHENQSGKLSLFMLPPGSELSTRSDGWLILSLSSVATLSSIALSSTSGLRTMPEKASLVISSFLFTISIIVGAGYRYTPFRKVLTSRVYCLRTTKETIVAVLCLSLATVVTSIVMDPALYIAIGGNAVWNANVFFATWGSLYTCFYLVADLITTNDSSGLVESRFSSPRGLSYFDSVAKIWWMLLGSNVSLLGVLFEFSNTVCASAAAAAAASSLSTASVCERAFGAALLCIFSILLNLTALAVYRLALLGEMRRSRLESFNGPERAFKASRRVGSALAFLVLALQSTAVALVSSPSGPGVEGGSVFLCAWLSFGLSLAILKAYVESFCLPNSAHQPKRPLVQPKFFDDSFRTFGTVGTTDFDDSDKCTDEEKLEPLNVVAPELYYIEQQKPLSNNAVNREIVQHVHPNPTYTNQAPPRSVQEPLQQIEQQHSFYSRPTSSKANSNPSDEKSKLSVDPKGVKASFTSITEPVVFTRTQCDISTVTHEPVGFKSGSSYYGGIAPEGSIQGAAQRQIEQDDEDSLPFMYPVSYISVGTKSEDGRKDQPEKKQQGLKGLQRRSSYCSIPSLPVLKEGSIESSLRDDTNTTGSRKQQQQHRRDLRKSVTSKNSKASSKVSKTSKVYKYKLDRRGSDGSSTISDPKTVAEIEFKLPQGIHDNASCAVSTSEEFSIVCDNKSIVTEITTEGFDNPAHVPWQPPRLPNKNPLYNGSDESTSSGMPTPRLNAFNNSVDDLVASALSYARKSRNNQSARTLATMSPTPSSSSSYLKSEYLPQRPTRPRSRGTPKSHKIKKSSAQGSTPNPSPANAKANRRGSLQSLYSTSNSGDGMAAAGMDFAC
jgi:hypothetical protein